MVQKDRHVTSLLTLTYAFVLISPRTRAGFRHGRDVPLKGGQPGLAQGLVGLHHHTAPGPHFK